MVVDGQIIACSSDLDEYPYPTLGLDLLNSDQTITLGLTADFDTGVHSVFADLDRLTESQVIELTWADILALRRFSCFHSSYLLDK